MRSLALPWAVVLCLRPVPAGAEAAWVVDAGYRALVSRADLVYEAPASRGVEGQPIGNGRMGTMVWTTPGAIHCQINRVDVFAVNKDHAGARDGPADYCGGCAQVTVDVGGTPFAADGPFEQRLSLYDAESTIAGNDIRARCFISSAADVLALEIDDRRDEPQPVRVTVSMWRAPEVRNGAHTAEYAFAPLEDRVLLAQRFTEGEHYCASAVAAEIAGRSVQCEAPDETKRGLIAPAKRGKTLVLISSAASWSPQRDPRATARDLLARAAERSYGALREEHRRWWAGLWSRTFIHLSSDDGVADFMERVRNLHLYCMAAGSRGMLPAKWNGSVFITEGDARAWGSQFWIWTTEVAHWPLYAADAVELTDPWFDMYVRQLPACEEAARQRWAAGGAYFLEAGPFDGPVVLPDGIAREYQDVYLGRKPNTELSAEALALGQFECVLTQLADGRQPPMIANGRYSYVSHIVSSGCELAVQAWWRYRYTGDVEWLRTHAYPLLRGTVEFYRDLAEKGEDGFYHLRGLNQHEGYWGVNDGIIDLAAIRGTTPLAILAAETLGVDAELRARWQEFLDNLAPYVMGVDPGAKALGGVLADDVWAVGRIGEVEGTHNVDELLWPVFPFEDWTLETQDPSADRIVGKIAELAPFRQQLANGEAFGSAIRLPIMTARAGRDADLPWVLASYFHAYPSLPNGFSLFEGPTVPSAEHLGCIGTALNEALLQSVAPRPGEPEVIRVFPAWPRRWDASFRLQARGGFLVSSAVRDGNIEFVEVLSRRGEDLRLRNPWGRRCIIEGEQGARMETEGEVLRLGTTRGGRYLIYPVSAPRPGLSRVTAEPSSGPASYSFTLPSGKTVGGTLGIVRP